jgi:hypothetical protein
MPSRPTARDPLRSTSAEHLRAEERVLLDLQARIEERLALLAA